MFLKFLIVRSLLFEEVNFLHTLLVELCYILILFGLVELITSHKLKRIIYIVLNGIITILLFAILIYNNYFGYIVTANALKQIDQVGTIKDSVFQLIEPVYFILFLDFMAYIIYAIIKRKSPTIIEGKKNYFFIIAVLLIGIGVAGSNLYLQKDTNIADTVAAAKKQGIVTYEILALANNYIAGNNQLTREEIKQLPTQINELKEITSLPEDERQLYGIAKDKNIIYVQLEAFQDFTLNLKVNGQEVTPFLNDLIQESLYFNNVYQQIGPGNTSDAEFMSNTSLYPSAWESTSETFGNRVIPSFPKVLKENDYKSLTFHANDVSFWNRINLYPALGFDQFYSSEFFGGEDVIGIGPSDEVLYTKALPELKALYKEKQKFYAQFITLSSHHPFKIPETKDLLDLPKQYQGSLVGDYLQAIYYTDQALKQFVAALKEEGMWEDTILVLYGDHFGLQPSGLQEQDFTLLAEIFGRDYTFLDQFNIPLIISVGDQNIGEVNDTIGSQIDIVPTVANLVGVSLENNHFIHFGQDLLNYPNNLFGMRYYMPYGTFFNNEIVFRPIESFEDGEAFNLHTGASIQDFTQYKEDYDKIMKLLELNDQYMNSLPIR